MTKTAMMKPRQTPATGPAQLLRQPLFRLLAINLAAGITIATLLIAGLLVVNPAGLRDLIFADRSPGVGLGLLLFGFIVTFGSAMMGSAIMALGYSDHDDDPPGGKRTGLASLAAALATVHRAPRG